jgi:hypothetical protein
MFGIAARNRALAGMLFAFVLAGPGFAGAEERHDGRDLFAHAPEPTGSAAPASDDEGPDGPGAFTPCRRTAQGMHAACLFDAREEYLVAGANCLNLSSASASHACRTEASADRRDALATCHDQLGARFEACDVLDEYRYDPDPLLDPDHEFVDVDEIPDVVAPNPWLSLEAGQVRVLSSHGGSELVVILTTDETRELNGVDCRIVAELGVEVEDDEGQVAYVASELTFDYFAQTEEGDVVYCGENTVEYEDGFPASTDGTFLAGVDRAKSGFLILAAPAVGAAHRQEFALGEAEDYIVYQSLGTSPPAPFGGENEAFPCGGACLRTLDLTPLEPGHGEWKFYLPEVGFVLALGFRVEDDDLVWTGGREELACSGDSLDVLDDCGIRSPAALRETLCNVAGEYFCPE